MDSTTLAASMSKISQTNDIGINSHANTSSLPDNVSKTKPEPWRSGDPFQNPIPKDGDSWEKCNKLLEQYDKDVCKSWTDEVQNLLIFAGLFSAVVTAFTIESYKMLQEDPSDASAQFLEQILAQLQAQSNGSQTSTLPPRNQFTVPPEAIRINIFWFTSLTLSLATVLAGTLCLQWLREYRKYEHRPYRDVFALRQMRFEGLREWHVLSILSGLPLLFQAALVLFFIGLLDMLRSLNHKVALAVAVVVGLILLFLVGTTIMPAAQCILTGQLYLCTPQCPFKSPQSWAFFQGASRLISFGLRVLQGYRHFPRPGLKTEMMSKFSRASSWLNCDIVWRDFRDRYHEETDNVAGGNTGNDIGNGLNWVGMTFVDNIDVVHVVEHCLRDLEAVPALKTSLAFRIKEPDNSHERVIREICAAHHQWWQKDLIKFSLDLSSAWTLHCITSHTNREVKEKLLLHRIELYIRIKTSAPSDIIHAFDRLDLQCPNIDSFLVPRDDSWRIPTDFQIQLLNCVSVLLDRDAASTGDLRAAWVVVSVTLETEDPPNISTGLQFALGEFFTSVDKWLSCPDTSPGSTRKECLCKCVNQMIELCAFLGLNRHANSRLENQLGYESLHTLISLMERMDALLNDLEVLASWDDMDIYFWNTMTTHLRALPDMPPGGLPWAYGRPLHTRA